MSLSRCAQQITIDLEEAQALKLRIASFVMLLIVSWVVMTMTHEVGHIVGGYASGAVLQDVDLRPWHMPYSLFEPDPHPLITLWCGPILGVLVPIGCAAVARKPFAWFVAHFCLLANGSYLLTAWIAGDRYLDTPRLLDAGAWRLSIAAYCATTIGFGYIGFRRQCQAWPRNPSPKLPA